MDAPGEKIKFQPAENVTVIAVPAKLQNKVSGKYAICFKVVL